MMKNLIIIGAGGMGRTLFDIARESIGYGERFVVKGFLDNNIYALDGYVGYPPILGTVDGYRIEPEDVFSCSIGCVSHKKAVCEEIVARGGEFITLIHRTARISLFAKIGIGCTVLANVGIGPNAMLGNFVFIQNNAIVAHDATVGDWTRIDTNVVCVGGVCIGHEVTIHTAAIISHNVTVEPEAIVGAGSFVIRRVKSNTTVHGNPAKKL